MKELKNKNGFHSLEINFLLLDREIDGEWEKEGMDKINLWTAFTCQMFFSHTSVIKCFAKSSSTLKRRTTTEKPDESLAVRIHRRSEFAVLQLFLTSSFLSFAKWWFSRVNENYGLPIVTNYFCASACSQMFVFHIHNSPAHFGQLVKSFLKRTEEQNK